MKLLQVLDHENIISLVEMMVEKSTYFYAVMLGHC